MFCSMSIYREIQLKKLFSETLTLIEPQNNKIYIGTKFLSMQNINQKSKEFFPSHPLKTLYISKTPCKIKTRLTICEQQKFLMPP